MAENIPQAPQEEFVLFTSADGQTRVECRFESDTLWLSQAMIGELYWKAKATISEHIKNIFTEGELDEKAVVRYNRTTALPTSTFNFISETTKATHRSEAQESCDIFQARLPV